MFRDIGKSGMNTANALVTVGLFIGLRFMFISQFLGFERFGNVSWEGIF